MIRIGGMVLLLGAVFLILPSKYLAVSLIGIFFLGVGGAPIFPCAMHLTPMIFGKENSSRIISLQMASAYLASTFIPYFFGVVAEYKGMEIYPFFLLSFIVVIVLIIRKTRSLCEANK
jgi:MFS family permease